MKLEFEQIGDELLRIALDGRLDIQGAQAIDMKFTALTATRKAGIIVDLSRVDFLASIGIRTLLSNAKAAANRGGRMVLCSPQPLVREVLETSGVASLIPVYDDPDSAEVALRALQLG
jgi:anti-sigma B factor antagonist